MGWNYRLPEFNAAIALAQLERIDELIALRARSADLFINAMSECGYLIPQLVPQGYTNSYYTLGAIYEGKDAIDVSWEDFRKAYIEAGGDGIYAAWSVPYLEPVIAERKFVKSCPWVYNDVEYKKGLCPVAENIQQKMMQFKTNYRDLKLARIKSEILRKVIKNFK